jgi:hypothetical protein
MEQIEREMMRIRALNEKLALAAGVPPASVESSGARTPSGMASPSLNTHPISPPPDRDVHLASVSGDSAPKEDSSGSEGGF